MKLIRPTKTLALICFLIAARHGADQLALGQLAPGTDGRLLDANNQVGSGGINSAAPRNLFNTSNLYITGNTTRGTSFQGFSPVRNQFSLFTTLPSTALANFERDSVGFEVLTGFGGVGVTNPYFNRTQTVANAGAISRGQNVIGSSAPANNLFAPTYHSRATDQGVAGSSYLANEFNINPASPSATFPGTTPLSQYSGYANSLDRLRMTRETTDLQSSPLFPRTNDRFSLTGTPVYQNPYQDPHSDSGDSLLRETTRLNRSRRSIDDPLRRPSSEEMLTASSELVSPTSVAPRLFQSSLSEAQRDPLTGRVMPNTSQYLAIRGDDSSDLIRDSSLAIPVTTTSAIGGTPGSMESTYSEDLAGDLQGYTPDAVAAASGLLEELESDPSVADSDNVYPEMQEQVERAQTVLERAASESLSTLAGASQSSSAQLISEAEGKVQEGKYYQAAKLYEMASQMDPEQAMPKLGHAHALFAAGEFMTAYRRLVHAIEMYPAFGYLNFDLTTFIPDANLIDIRRANLEERLKIKEDYRLRFLLGYVEYYIGLEQFGLPNLRRAAGDAPAGSIPARFPDILARPGAANKSAE
jgi:tetratricopeptide (TPR) repeat protein